MANVHQYLDRYAEHEAGMAARLPTFENVVVIPSFAERENLLSALVSIREPGTCAIVVLNEPEHASDADRAANDWVRGALGHQLESVQPAALSHVRLGYLGEVGVLLVDRCGPRALNAKQGVGLARKIGCDIAVALRAHGRLRSEWIHTTDADVRLPPDYFLRARAGAAAAGVFPFWHEPQPGFEAATAIYEVYLRYLVAGLRYAGSPFSFHTVGSCIAVRSDAYVSARGFPRRAAGEDFYLLNKLRKLGPVTPLHGSPIRVAGRPSWRTPFGTGPALLRIDGDPEGFSVYAPQSFDYLAALWEALGRLKPQTRADEFLEHLCGALRERHLDVGIGAAAALQADIPSSVLKSTQQGQVRPLEIVDAFRQLKYLHALRALGLRSVPWRTAVAEAAFLDVDTANLDALRTTLFAQEMADAVSRRVSVA